MDAGINTLIECWRQRNISAVYYRNKEEAADAMLGMIPRSASVGISGSQTLEQLGIVRRLVERGTKVFDPYKSEISRDESLTIRRKGAVEAEYYLASANGVSRTGELVFLSAFGNRIAGVSYAPKVIVVCGINKLVPTLDEALARAREYATPLNCKRLNWKGRMCCQVLIIEAEPSPDRLSVILVGEDLGY